MRQRTRTRRVLAWGAVALTVASVAIAQRALDASLQVGSQGRNPDAQKMTMSAPIYRVNRNTGEMVYDRANAFRDPSYRIYQRYTVDRFSDFDNPRPSGVPDNRAGAMLSRERYNANTGRPSYQARSRASVVPTQSPRAHVPSRYRAPSLRASATPRADLGGAMRQPTYSAHRTRAPHAGGNRAASLRVR